MGWNVVSTMVKTKCLNKLWRWNGPSYLFQIVVRNSSQINDPWDVGSFCCSLAKSCPTLCNYMDCSSPGTPVLHYLLEFCLDSCPLSCWCYLTISSSVAPFSFCLQSFPAPGSFPVSQLFPSGGQSTGASSSASVLPKNIQGWFPLGVTGLISFQSKERSRIFSSTTTSNNFSVPSLLYGPTLTSVYGYWKNDSFDNANLCQPSDVSAFQYAV